jgi:hypothetical protein
MNHMLRVMSDLLIMSALLGSVPAFALDGVVLIDQNHALAGNITPGDAPGFPVTISQSGSYRLSGNLTVPGLNTTAIQITADFVTLDLNGFSIIGPAVCTSNPTKCPPPGTGIGVQAGGPQKFAPRGVRVLNGSVRGMGVEGILMTGDGSSVEKVTADSNAGGGMSVAGRVIESAATQNGGSFGIIATTVRDCTAVQNFGDGIIINAGGVATGNVASFNGGHGIGIFYGTATGNTLFLNNASGISAFCPSSIIGNTVVSNGPGSIETNGAGCALANNATRP